MTNEDVAQATKLEWLIWARTAGIAYPIAALLLVAAAFTGGPAFVIGGLVAMLIATVGAVGFVNRYLKMKR